MLYPFSANYFTGHRPFCLTLLSFPFSLASDGRDRGKLRQSRERPVGFFFTTLQIARSRIKTILDEVAPSSSSNKILELGVFITTLIASSQIAY